MHVNKIALAAAGAFASVQATGESNTSSPLHNTPILTGADDKGPIITNVAVVHEFPAVSISTVLSTSYITVTGCGPNVTDCPVSTQTSVVAVSTTICPRECIPKAGACKSILLTSAQ